MDGMTAPVALEPPPPAAVEVALLAHLVLNETHLDGWTVPRLSRAARTLREIIGELPAAARTAGVAALVRFLHQAPTPELLALAVGVDALTLEELTRLGPLPVLLRALGARPRTRRPRAPRGDALSPALERELRSA